MSVIALVTDGDRRTVVQTPEEFESARGLQGTTVLIERMDPRQLIGDSSNVSYDLRIGGEYRDHRENGRHDLRDKEEITLHPGSAVIVETEESVRLPKTRFACVVPKVELLKKGLSNTMSKVDPGYDGHLLITIFNLGKKTETLRRHDAFCSLCFFQVDGDVNLYRKGEKRIEEGKAGKGWWRSFRDKVERNTALVIIVVPIVSMVCQIVVLVVQKYLEH